MTCPSETTGYSLIGFVQNLRNSLGCFGAQNDPNMSMNEVLIMIIESRSKKSTFVIVGPFLVHFRQPICTVLSSE